ncbi:hypothetical protein HanIR_Chr13g0639601 [Helianthus annuus]|nr:hypothetical protein HanIR_Chr13g0639601 [Helianthus annuus]
MAVPCVTIPYSWNLLTASYIEQTIHGVVISTIGLLFIGRLLEPIWGSREFLKFIFVVNFFTNVCVFITVIFVYYITMEEIYIYMPLSGFCGALLGLLVGVKEIIPDQELSLLQIKVKWVPYIVIFLSIGLSLFMVEPATCLPILIFSTYIGWIYLRYFQRKQETKITEVLGVLFLLSLKLMLLLLILREVPYMQLLVILVPIVGMWYIFSEGPGSVLHRQRRRALEGNKVLSRVWFTICLWCTR